MKKTLFPIVLLSALFAVVSCSKSFDPSEDGLVEATDAKVFTASIESSDTKTALGTGNKVNWVSGDEISINGALYTATPRIDATQADFSGSGATKKDNLYKAYYPSVLYNGGTPTLPSSYTYNADYPFEVYPMYAQSEKTSLSFSNICGVLAITVKSSVLSNVKSITVSSSNCAMSGAFSVEETTTGSGKYKASLTSPTTVANTVTLNCGESGVETTSGGTVFYIPIPAQTYQNIKIVVIPATGYSLTMVTKKDQNISVARNTIYPINFNHNGDILSGEFTVNSDGKKVKFSPGNLYYDGSSWNFETNQYDYRTYAGSQSCINGTINSTGTPSNHWGLFGWSTTATNNNWGMHIQSSMKTSYIEGNFKDWGQNTISGYPANTWRTLTSDELTYLIDTRTVNSGTGEGYSYQRAYINYVSEDQKGVYGLILYPDNYTSQTTSTSYTAADWSTMESAGCVFLPAAGCRNCEEVENPGSYGVYWSSTPDGSKDAYYLYSSSDDVSLYDQGDRATGAPVRLVQ